MQLYRKGDTLVMHYKYIFYNFIPITKKRLNITLPEDIDKTLSIASKRDGIPLATKAIQFIQFALEIEEDDLWNQIALERDQKSTSYVSHDEAWQ